MEARLDRYGAWLQQWIYHHILPRRDFTLHAWGVNDPALPAWQRLCITGLFPVQRVLMRRVFRLRPGSHEKTVKRIEEFLGELEQLLGDGRGTLLGGKEISFVDISLASLSGLWLNPPKYGGGRAEGTRPNAADYPESMATEMAAWRQKFPRVTDFVEKLYRQERSVVSA